MIVFQNKGSIDPLSIKTFGVSAKETTNPIGFFGTGLKYAIAVLLRTGHEVTILSGREIYKFTTERATLRNSDFDFICMNGEKLAFTTELGKTWELWMAFRELYSNVLDEKGRCMNLVPGESAMHKPDMVSVVVEGDAFESIYASRGEYFLCESGLKPVFAWGNIEVYDRPSTSLYYRGILVGGMEGRRSNLTYNVLSKQTLSEDRVLVSTWNAQWHITQALVLLTDDRLLRKALLGGTPSFEGGMTLSNGGTPTREFCDFVRRFKHEPGMLKGAIEAVMKAPGGHTLFEAEPVELFPYEEAVVARAKKILLKVQAPIKYPIVVTEDLPSTTLAYVVTGGDTIYLNRTVLSQGATRVASTLFEENAHLQRGLHDESRDMQNFLLDTLFGVIERLP